MSIISLIHQKLFRQKQSTESAFSRILFLNFQFLTKMIWILIWVTLSESFRTSIRGFSGSNHEDIFWNFPNWSTSNLRNWVSIYRQLQADCLYHINCLYNFPAYTWRQKRNAFPGLCSGSIFMIQKNLIIILGTEPRILCSEVIRKNNSSMTHLNRQSGQIGIHIK